MIKYLFILLASISYASIEISDCPDNPENILIIIDSCPTMQADYITIASEFPCQNINFQTHADKVIRTYKSAGGGKSVWLFAYMSSRAGEDAYTLPIKKAIECNIKTISVSAAGTTFFEEEKILIRKFISMGGKYYAAAGNDNVNLDTDPRYPAAYNNVITVGALDCLIDGPSRPSTYTNYGSIVSVWECGHSADGVSFGTSFATPRFVAKQENNF